MTGIECRKERVPTVSDGDARVYSTKTNGRLVTSGPGNVQYSLFRKYLSATWTEAMCLLFSLTMY